MFGAPRLSEIWRGGRRAPRVGGCDSPTWPRAAQGRRALPPAGQVGVRRSAGPPFSAAELKGRPVWSLGFQTQAQAGPDLLSDLGQVTASFRTSVCTSIKWRGCFSPSEGSVGIHEMYGWMPLQTEVLYTS